MLVRRSILDQISVDPMTGISNGLPAETATLLAWGTDEVVPLEIEGQKVRHLSNVLYEVALPYSISGTTTFRYDLLRTSVIDMESEFFTKDPWTIKLGPGAARVAYRPIPFEGTFAPAAVTVGMTFGGDLCMPAGKPATSRRPSAATRPPRAASPPRTACRTSRCSTSGRGHGCSSSISRRVVRTSSPMRRAGLIPRRARSRSGSSTRASSRWASSCRSRSRGRSDDRHRARPPVSSSATTGRSRWRASTSTSPRGDLRARRTERRRQDHHAAHPGHAARPRPGRRRDRRCVRPPEPQRRPPRPRVHAGLVRGLRRHEGLGVPGLLRALLRDPCGAPPADHRRPAGAGRPRAQARLVRADAVARHAAAPVPRPHARPRPAGAAPRRTGLGPRPTGARRAPRAAARAPVTGQDDPRQLAHPPRARGAVHLRGDHRPGAGAGPGQGRRDRATPARRARSSGSGSSATPRRTRRHGPGSPGSPTS